RAMVHGEVSMKMDASHNKRCRHAKSRAHDTGQRRIARGVDMKMDAPMAQVRRCRHAKRSRPWRRSEVHSKSVDMKMDAPMAQ
ncbi:hypothetical protein KI387_017343, partial [Taxus chinensis]